MYLFSIASYAPRHELDIAYNWRDDAACAFAPSELFELLDEEHPSTSGMNRKQIKAANDANHAAAAKICAKCPVIEECLASATSDDLRYTFRAGGAPEEASVTKRRAEARREWRNRVQNDPALRARGRTCTKGHWVPPSESGKWQRCLTCKNAARNASRDQLRNQGLPTGNL